MNSSQYCALSAERALPLPTAAADHQTANARALAAAGAAVHIPQSELTAERLDRVVHDVVLNSDLRSSLATAARQRGRPDAADLSLLPAVAPLSRDKSNSEITGAIPAPNASVAAASGKRAVRSKA